MSEKKLSREVARRHVRKFRAPFVSPRVCRRQQRGPNGGQRGGQRVEHGPVTRRGPAHLHDPLQPCAKRADPAFARGGGVTCRGKEDGQQNAGRAAHCLAEFGADGPVKLCRIGQRQSIQRRDQGARGPGQRAAGIPVA